MSDERFILCQDDLGNYEIRYDDNVFHFLWEVAPILNEQQDTIIKQKEEIKKLKKTERSWRRIHCCNKESDNCGIVIEQQEMIDQLEKENDELKKQLEDCKDYNSKIYAYCLQKDRKWIKEVKRLEEELEECIKENAKLREMYINDE